MSSILQELESQIAGLKTSVQKTNVGTVREIGDGVAKVEGLSVAKDRIKFGVRNAGTAHALVENVHVEFMDAAGKVLSSSDTAGWYVLPSRTRAFDIEIGKSLSCAGAKKLVVTASSRQSGSATATIDQPACVP